MIARMWRGWADPDTAAHYHSHYESAVAAHLADTAGFQGAYLLRRRDGNRVLFTSLTLFTDLDAVRAFAGPDYHRALVEDAARVALTAFDQRVSHHDVVVELARR